jgi:tetratricopeptide (TPR) repeat protein
LEETENTKEVYHLMKRFRSNLYRLLLALSVMALMFAPGAAVADIPYDTMTRDSFGDLVYTQAAYLPVGVMGQSLYEPDSKNPGGKLFSRLKGPKDLFVTESNEVYVADTGNNRVVHLSETGEVIRVITLAQSPLKNPQGVFVTKEGDIYVADTGNQRVLRLDPKGSVVKEYKKPKSAFIPDSFKFDPVRLVVDKRGYLYIATIGGYQGLLQLDPDGEFQGFFGANYTAFSFTDSLKRFFYTREMYGKELSKLPGSVNSVAVDKDGFLYTVTGGSDIGKNQIKKLNYSGQDMLSTADAYALSSSRKFGEVRRENTNSIKPQLIDLTVDRMGNITAIDAQFKYISQYDANGNLLFFWSGNAKPGSVQIGLIKNPVAIKSNSAGELYILDDQEAIIQVFRPSEFGDMVHKANALTLEGKYEESDSLWRQVLKYNAKYAPALLGIAKSAYKKGDYEEAMAFFREAGNQRGYSDAFWQIRLQWFQKHFALIANTVLIAGILLAVLERMTRRSPLRKKWQNRSRSSRPLIVQLKHVLTVMRHPIDGFSAIRFEGKGTYACALLLLAGTYATLCLVQGTTSFTFNKSADFPLNYSMIFVQFFSVWIVWVVCSYLIGSIMQGEARFRDVFIGSSYCLAPITLVGLPLALISNAMTMSEAAIYGFFSDGLLIWVALLFFWSMQSLQNYSVGETLATMVTTLFTMLIFAVLAAITVGLTDDLYQFIYSIYQEVKLR